MIAGHPSALALTASLVATSEGVMEDTAGVLGCEAAKGTSTKRPRPCGPTSALSDSQLSLDGESTLGQSKNQRTHGKQRSRTPEAQARNAEMERARKKRLREGQLKEEEKRSVKQKLEGPVGDTVTERPELPGALPAATAQEEHAQPKLTRGGGYDTTNNMNLFLTQCCGCSNPVRNKKTLFDALVQQITNLEDHGVLNNHLEDRVCGHLVVDVLHLVRKELKGKDPHVSKAHLLASDAPVLSLSWP